MMPTAAPPRRGATAGTNRYRRRKEWDMTPTKDNGWHLLSDAERETVADALTCYAEGVQENLEDDDLRDHEAEMDGEPVVVGDRDLYPVVEDYLADADRIRAGDYPIHELTREVLRDDVDAITDDPAEFAELVSWLYEERRFMERMNGLQARYDRLTAHRARLINYYDECPDGDPRAAQTLRQLGEVGERVREAEDDIDKAIHWYERKQEGVKTARLLNALPVGAEFRLTDGSTAAAERRVGGYLVGAFGVVSRAYVALYRKNEKGMWDQVPGTCEPPHVVNLDPAHLGFVVGYDAVRAAVEG